MQFHSFHFGQHIYFICPNQCPIFPQEIPGAIKFRKKGLQNEGLLRQMFEDITNDGADHWSPAMGILPQTQAENTETVNLEAENDIDEMDETELEEESPSNGKGKRVANAPIGTGKKPKSSSAQVMQDQIIKIANMAKKSQSTLESFAMKDDPCSIDVVMNWVKECAASLGSDEHFIATELFLKREQRQMFKTLDTPQARFEWLKRKYKKEYGN